MESTLSAGTAVVGRPAQDFDRREGSVLIWMV